MRGILQKLGLNSEEQDQVFDRLLDGDAAILSQVKAEKPALAPLLALQGKSSGFIKNMASSLVSDLPGLKPQIDDFVYIADTLQSLGYDYQIDIASVRGFEYYTGMIFQLFLDNEKVGGGGRYDALIPAMGGQNVPASGFALYLDLLMKRIKPEKAGPTPAPKVLVKMEEGTARLGLAVSGQLREAGYIVKWHLGGKGPTDIAWRLDIRNQTPGLLLTDAAKRKKYELNSTAEILEILKRR
jgi:histidyl-tRNA synthetase